MVLYGTTALHFMEKSPLKCPIVQYAVYFYHSYIVKNQGKFIRGFGLLSERLFMLKRLPSSKYVGKAKEQYKIFVKDVLTSYFEKFETFDMFQQTVDEFLDSFLSDRNFFHVYDIVKIICTLPYGQPSIERRFSINKEHLEENLQEESLIALCIVNDQMFANNLSLSNIQISKAMLENVRTSNRRYKNMLQERRDAQNENIKSHKRKQLSQQNDEIAKKESL